MPYCELCGSPYGLEYCGMCKSWFCQTCKTRYPQRVAAAMKRKMEQLKQLDPLGAVLSFFGVK